MITDGCHIFVTSKSDDFFIVVLKSVGQTAGQQIVVRSRASTPFAAPRPTDRTHTHMTKARPTQPTIPARPDTLTLGTSLPQRLETLTELRREAETQQQQQNWKFTKKVMTFILTTVTTRTRSPFPGDRLSSIFCNLAAKNRLLLGCHPRMVSPWAVRPPQ